MSSSDFRCRCGFKLGTVKNGVLRHPPSVGARNYLSAGYAILTCPRCQEERPYRGGIVEARRIGSRIVVRS